MGNTLVDERDVHFVLYEQLDVEKLCKTQKYKDFTKQDFDMVIEEARKLAVNVLLPTNGPGDKEGCKYENGKVKVPECFHEAFRLYIEGGWLTPTEDPEIGGQGLPFTVFAPLEEYFAGANGALGGYVMLTHGAAKLIEIHGTEEQKKKYMEKMYAGQWTGTMCLTEPGAGSDVGATKTTAKKNEDGTYTITGTKSFITAGEHDLAENIIHPVLARIEGAPPGTKGISLFLVPKIKVNEDGSLGEENDVFCSGIEHKLGIHGSATTTLNFGDNGKCIGELLGEENKGMRIMFHMMNEARLGVGLQSLGQASSAYLNAVAYAKERLQGASILSMGDPHAPQVAIINHPDVRRMLLWMKSYVEGMRAFTYYISFCQDMEIVAPDETEREKYADYIALLTPICKGFFSDISFQVIKEAIQVYGGYGYCCEYPVEQLLRDNKIASIYEGANGIQALDLVGRKLGMKKGTVLMNFFTDLSNFVEENKSNETLKTCFEELDKAKNALADVSMYFGQIARGPDFMVPLINAYPYLETFGRVVIGWMLLWQAVIADRKLKEIITKEGASDEEAVKKLISENKDAAFYSGKLASAKYYSGSVLPLVSASVQSMKEGDKTVVEMAEESFVS
ncbi:MAG: acyl-CoA dehydrogenase [Thermodesulfobacteriota bacterium]|nr:acyl-CoA dehydrogenase [Thermodesulfobacteriota bacterium]